MDKMLARILFPVLVLLFFLAPIAKGQHQSLKELFRNTHNVFALQRNNLGIYRDSKVFNGADFHPASVANIGIGLIDLCIADAMEWITDGEEQVLLTLKNITGSGDTYDPDRNITGFYRHFLNMNTGAQAWDSEYSTIDSGILTAGALFAKNYFCSNDSIALYVDLLWNTTDWSQAIANPETGAIYREMLVNGAGKAGSESYPFNEYMLVAWLAMQQEIDLEGPAHQLWERHYISPDNLLKRSYEGIDLLADNPNYFLSHFVVQFAYYLCHAFTRDETYILYLENARMADSLWWALETEAESYQWGHGAGSSPGDTSYVAHSLNHNPYQVYSPHIIGGFIPVYPAGADDLIQLYEAVGEPYALPSTGQEPILWRRSLALPGWSAREIQGIDYSSMLFGLASHPQFLGKDFFQTYNNFFDFECLVNTDDTPSISEPMEVMVFPNPFQSEFHIKLSGTENQEIHINLLNIQGQVLFSQSKQVLQGLPIEIIIPGLSSGMYLLVIQGKHDILAKKVVKE